MAPFLGRIGNGGGSPAGFGFGRRRGGPRGPIPFSATGGTKTTIGSYTYHDFTSTGPNPFVVTGDPKSANILLIGGGGGGSNNNPGNGGQAGGGAGGVIIAPLSLNEGSYTVVVGQGGPAYANGGDSTFGPNWVAQGGGRGLWPGDPAPNPGTTQGGSPGGSYGGTISPLNQTNNPALPVDSRTFGYGNQGAPAAPNGPPGFGGGGGGGSGGAGQVGQPNAPGAGGSGLPTTPIPWLNGTPFFSPTSQFFAGGGGGASRAGSAPGGSGGGGAGNHGGVGGSATSATGSGGGGGGSGGGAGGPGRVIIAYLTT